MNKKSDKNTHEQRFGHLDIKTSDAVSSTDYTGLMPISASPEDIEEYEKILGFGNDIPNK